MYIGSRVIHVVGSIAYHSDFALLTRSTDKVRLFGIVTHRLLTIYFTGCTLSRVPAQKYLLGTKFTNSKARSRSLLEPGVK